jgi:hypothetical protein
VSAPASEPAPVGGGEPAKVPLAHNLKSDNMKPCHMTISTHADSQQSQP